MKDKQTKLKEQIKRLDLISRIFKCVAYFCLGLMWGCACSNRHTIWLVAIILSIASVLLSAIFSWRKVGLEYKLGIEKLKLENQTKFLVIHNTGKVDISPNELLTRFQTDDDIEFLFSEEEENERENSRHNFDD